MSRIDLSKVPELRGFIVVKTNADLENFFLSLSQETHPYAKSLTGKEAVKVRREFQHCSGWGHGNPNIQRLIAYRDEKDDHSANDGWGAHHVHTFAIFVESDGSLRVFEAEIASFHH